MFSFNKASFRKGIFSFSSKNLLPLEKNRRFPLGEGVKRGQRTRVLGEADVGLIPSCTTFWLQEHRQALGASVSSSVSWGEDKSDTSTKSPSTGTTGEEDR